MKVKLKCILNIATQNCKFLSISDCLKNGRYGSLVGFRSRKFISGVHNWGLCFASNRRPPWFEKKFRISWIVTKCMLPLKDSVHYLVLIRLFIICAVHKRRFDSWLCYSFVVLRWYYFSVYFIFRILNITIDGRNQTCNLLDTHRVC